MYYWLKKRVNIEKYIQSYNSYINNKMKKHKLYNSL